jgi:hypothetical protein
MNGDPCTCSGKPSPKGTNPIDSLCPSCRAFHDRQQELLHSPAGDRMLAALDALGTPTEKP